MSESKHIYIVYKTTNLVNGKFYIGVHKQDFFLPIIFDGYLGSGLLLKKAIKKYGKDNFRRETLHVFYTAKEAYKKEKELVNEAFVNRKDTYNLCGGGHGVSHFTEDHKKKLSESLKGLKKTEEHKKKLSESRKGKKLSGEHKKKLRQNFLGRKWITDGKTNLFVDPKNKIPNNFYFGLTKSEISKAADIKRGSKKEKHPLYGKHHSEFSKKKISITKKDKTIKNGKERFFYIEGKIYSQFDLDDLAKSMGITKKGIISRCVYGQTSFDSYELNNIESIGIKWKYFLKPIKKPGLKHNRIEDWSKKFNTES